MRSKCRKGNAEVDTGSQLQWSPYPLDLKLEREQVPSFDDYPFALPAIRDLSTLPFHPAVTFLVGENGSGKSTLLEAVAVASGFNAEGGSRNFNFATRASHSELHKYLLLRRSARFPRDGYFLRAESLFNVASEVERLGPEIAASYGSRALHEQSPWSTLAVLDAVSAMFPGGVIPSSRKRRMALLKKAEEECDDFSNPLGEATEVHGRTGVHVRAHAGVCESASA